jgi:hypothetical protein
MELVLLNRFDEQFFAVHLLASCPAACRNYEHPCSVYNQPRVSKGSRADRLAQLLRLRPRRSLAAFRATRRAHAQAFVIAKSAAGRTTTFSKPLCPVMCSCSAHPTFT